MADALLTDLVKDCLSIDLPGLSDERVIFKTKCREQQRNNLTLDEPPYINDIGQLVF